MLCFPESAACINNMRHKNGLNDMMSYILCLNFSGFFGEAIIKETNYMTMHVRPSVST